MPPALYFISLLNLIIILMVQNQTAYIASGGLYQIKQPSYIPSEGMHPPHPCFIYTYTVLAIITFLKLYPMHITISNSDSLVTKQHIQF